MWTYTSKHIYVCKRYPVENKCFVKYMLALPMLGINMHLQCLCSVSRFYYIRIVQTTFMNRQDLKLFHEMSSRTQVNFCPLNKPTYSKISMMVLT